VPRPGKTPDTLLAHLLTKLEAATPETLSYKLVQERRKALPDDFLLLPNRADADALRSNLADKVNAVLTLRSDLVGSSMPSDPAVPEGQQTAPRGDAPRDRRATRQGTRRVALPFPPER
jgi:hypothetical protein